VDNADDVYWGAFGNVCSIGSSGVAKKEAEERKMQELQDSCCERWLVSLCHYNATVLQDSKDELQKKVTYAQGLKDQFDTLKARVEQLNSYLVARHIYVKDVQTCDKGTTSTSTTTTTTTTTATKAAATTTLKGTSGGVTAAPSQRSSTRGSSAALNVGLVVGLVVGAAVVAGIAAVAIGFFASASAATTPTAFTHSLMAGAQSSPLYESLTSGGDNAMF